jgi:hypothetical protein
LQAREKALLGQLAISRRAVNTAHGAKAQAEKFSQV